MFLVLVIEGFILNLAALIAGLHGAQYATAFGDALKFAQHRLFHQIGQLIEDKGPLVGVLIARQSPLVVDDQLDGQGAAH